MSRGLMASREREKQQCDSRPGHPEQAVRQSQEMKAIYERTISPIPVFFSSAAV